MQGNRNKLDQDKTFVINYSKNGEHTQIWKKNKQTRRKGNSSGEETREKRSLVWGSKEDYGDDPQYQDYPAAVVSVQEFMFPDWQISCLQP